MSDTVLPERFRSLPGHEMVESGLAALARGELSPPALVVATGAERLREAGVPVPGHEVVDPQTRLYEVLAREHGDDAHGRYNALLRELVSFARAAECAR